MKIKVTWDNADQHLLRFCFNPDWTWDDYYDALMQGMAMMASVVHTVDILFAMGPGTDIPESAFQVGLQTFQSLPGNARCILFCGSSDYIRMISTAFKRLNPRYSNRVFTFETMNDAIEWWNNHPADECHA